MVTMPSATTTPTPEPWKGSDDPRLLQLLEEFEANLSGLPPSLPPVREIDHRIELVEGSRPPAKRAYRLSPDELKELHSQLTDLLKRGFIRPSKSPYAAPILFVKKANGELRMCLDFRALNELTVKNRYPLPLIEDLLDQLKGATYFSKLDLASGYHQIRVAEDDVPKTAFTTRYGLFEFLVLPFGLTNAPATFMTLMHRVFHDYLDKFMLVYLDDLLIFSKSLDEHLGHLRLALQRLRDHHLFAKRSKCIFGASAVPFLGYVVSDRGLLTSPDKVETIRNWPAPTSVTELRQFLGLANFYNKFVRNFANIAAPLTSLLKKDVDFVWGPSAVEAFETLRNRLCSAPVLAFVDTSKPFLIDADASDRAVGAVLSQRDAQGSLRPVAFTSRKLREEELWFPVEEKETLAIIHALTSWRHYIGTARVQVSTDHQSLRFFRTRPVTDRRKARWLHFLSQFDLDIVYRPGKTNVVADALSRRPAELSVISTVMRDAHLLKDIKDGYADDGYFAGILDQLKMAKIPRTAAAFFMDDDLLYLSDPAGRRLCVPNVPNLRDKLLLECHSTPQSGHPGFDRTYDLLHRQFFWPDLYKDTKAFVRSCDTCQRIKPSNQLPQGLLHPLDIPSRNWEQVSLDFITGLPKTPHGLDSILVVVDKLSKYVKLIPTTVKVTAPETARLFIDHVYRHFGMPKVLISDRDPRFTSHFWKSFFDILGTHLAMSSASHQQTNGQTERMNHVVEIILRSLVNSRQTDWDSYLALVEFSINNAKQASTGHSPFYLNFGRHPATPSSFVSGADSPVQSVQDFLAHLSSLNRWTRDNLLRAQQKQAAFADRDRRDVSFQVGDEVLVTASRLRTDFQEARSVDKLADKWVGPYRISAVERTSVTLDLPANSLAWNVFHVSEVKLYQTPTVQVDLRPAPDFVDVAGGQHYVVERILDKRSRNKGRKRVVEYLVKWEGYPDYDSTWEPLEGLGDAAGAVQDYEALVLSGGVSTRAKQQLNGTG
jgi:hypothetical protein